MTNPPGVAWVCAGTSAAGPFAGANAVASGVAARDADPLVWFSFHQVPAPASTSTSPQSTTFRFAAPAAGNAGIERCDAEAGNRGTPQAWQNRASAGLFV
nr:hypothetical protein [Hydrogenophaga sp.]